MENQERVYYFKEAIGFGFIGALCTGILYVLLERSNLLESSPFHLMGGIYSFLKIYIPSFLGSYFSLRTWRWGEIERNGRKEYSVWLSTIMGTLFGYLIFFILFKIISFFPNDFKYLFLFRMGLVISGSSAFYAWTIIPTFIGAFITAHGRKGTFY